VPSYAAGIFSANLALGAALMLGLGSVSSYFDGPFAYGAQGVVGAALLAYAVLAPDKPKKEKRERKPRSLGLGSVFLLGMTITVLEFSTALPYLGAVAILTNAGLAAAQWLPVLAAYNLVFVAPPLLLLGAYRAFGARLRPALERWRERLQGAGRETLLWILGVAGFLLLADSLRYFEFFGLL
jgi:cytochrome c biogenesis protein CcdA